MGASSNFGNMFSVVGASIILPFLPMAPIQVLTNNLLYDFSQTAVTAFGTRKIRMLSGVDNTASLRTWNRSTRLRAVCDTGKQVSPNLIQTKALGDGDDPFGPVLRGLSPGGSRS
jgi:hypothetical protein